MHRTGDEIELFCDVFGEEEDPVESPGVIVWKVNGNEVARESTAYDQDQEAWTSKAKFTGQLDTEEISCHLVSTDSGDTAELSKESVSVTPILFEGRYLLHMIWIEQTSCK